MQRRSTILIYIAIEQPDALECIKGLLTEEFLSNPPAPFASIHVKQVPLSRVEECIRSDLGTSGNSGVVLISDGLIDEGDFQLPTTSAARGLLDAYGDSLFTMIAVMDQPCRVTNIERSISQRPDAAELARCLNRCLQKLAYLRRPAKAKEKISGRYVFRVLKFENELLQYFKFRYDVYSVMCYLDADAERAPSRLEIDWFDKTSLHLGVYYKEHGYQRLVGTGRLIATKVLPKMVPNLVTQVAQQDAVLRKIVSHAVGLQLPVFQSQKLIELVKLMLDKKVALGEVSRVIVDRDHRGLGLSLEITRRLIRHAKTAGMSDVLLECLPIHTAIYRRCGFKLMPNVSEKVYKIGRTMDVMALPLGAHSIVSPIFLEKEQ